MGFPLLYYGQWTIKPTFLVFLTFFFSVIFIIIIIIIIIIKRDFFKHRTVKTNDKIQRFGVVITPLSRKKYIR